MSTSPTITTAPPDRPGAGAAPVRQRRPRRRRRLVVAGAVVAVPLFVAGGLAADAYRDALRSNAGELGFANPLRIPPLAEATVAADGARVFDLTVAAGRAELLPGRTTETLGVNGPYLGPTLRARAGDRVQVNVSNRLAETTTMHWHGMHLPATADGGPHQPIAPGATWSPSWTVDQPAATLWYHAHPEGRTGDQVYRGVAGLFLLDDPAAEAAGLPVEYGVDDVPLVLQDKAFTDDGQLDRTGTRFSSIGILGDEILVNGTHDPHFAVTTTLVRLRLLNASTARTFDVGLADDRVFRMVATEAGLLPEPRELRRVLLAPSERAEIVVPLRAGERVVLRGWPTGVGGGRLPDRFDGGDDTFDLVRLDAAATLRPSSPLPARLPAPPAVDAGDAAGPERLFTFNHASRINGRSYDAGRVDFTVAPDSTEVWRLDNRSDNQHVFHVHGVSFSVLEYDGRPPPAHLGGLKDSLYLPPGTTARIAVRFRSFADPEAPYMFHCHLLAHEDHGMMGQFLVRPPAG